RKALHDLVRIPVDLQRQLPWQRGHDRRLHLRLPAPPPAQRHGERRPSRPAPRSATASAASRATLSSVGSASAPNERFAACSARSSSSLSNSAVNAAGAVRVTFIADHFTLSGRGRIGMKKIAVVLLLCSATAVMAQTPGKRVNVDCMDKTALDRYEG